MQVRLSVMGVNLVAQRLHQRQPLLPLTPLYHRPNCDRRCRTKDGELLNKAADLAPLVLLGFAENGVGPS